MEPLMRCLSVAALIFGLMTSIADAQMPSTCLNGIKPTVPKLATHPWQQDSDGTYHLIGTAFSIRLDADSGFALNFKDEVVSHDPCLEDLQVNAVRRTVIKTAKKESLE